MIFKTLSIRQQRTIILRDGGTNDVSPVTAPA